MARLLGADIHAVRHAPDRRDHHRLGTRMRYGIEAADLTERQMGGHDHGLRGYASIIGDDMPRVPVDHTALLEHVAAFPWNGFGKARHVFSGMELRLVVEADRASNVKRKPSLAREARGKAEGLRDLHLLLDSAEVALIAGIDVGGFRLELAVDGVLRDELLIFLTPASCTSA